MKEFIEKLIGRLEEIRLLHADLAQSEKLTEEEQITHARFCGCFTKAKQIVNELAEEYNNGWIPCSERLPEEEDYYLVTKEDDIAYSIDIALWNPHYHWSNNGFHKADKVIAWQPLPTPYKKED